MVQHVEENLPAFKFIYNESTTAFHEDTQTNWGSNSFYKKLESGTVSKNHIFTVEDSNPTTLLLKLDNIDSTPVSKQNLQKRGTASADCLEMIRNTIINIIGDPGIPDIKKVELYTKYRTLIPNVF
jgi:hypothetical protein